jgi:hypothetical protein
MAHVCTVPQGEYYDFLSSEGYMAKFRHKHHQEGTDQMLITVEEAAEVYMVETTAQSHFC